MNALVIVIAKPFSIPAVEEMKKYGFIAELAGADVNSNLVFHVAHEEPKLITEKFLELCKGLAPVKTAGHNPEVEFYCFKNPRLNCFYFLAGDYVQLVVCGNAGQYEKFEKIIEQDFLKM